MTDSASLAKYTDKATAAAAHVADEKQRKIAEKAIIACLIRAEGADSYFCWANGVCLFISLILAAMGTCALWLRWGHGWSIAALIGIGTMIAVLLGIIALHADGSIDFYNALPHRLPAVLMCAFLFIGILHGFGNLYLRNPGICASAVPCSVGSTRLPAITTPRDALYFSCVTVTTLGYGDIYPAGSHARWLVMIELGNSIVLLILIFPLVVARLADF